MRWTFGTGANDTDPDPPREPGGYTAGPQGPADGPGRGPLTDADRRRLHFYCEVVRDVDREDPQVDYAANDD